MDRYILLTIFFLLIGARCLEKRSGTEHEFNHCDFWRNWNFSNDISLQFESDKFISRGLTQICYFFNHNVLRNTLFSYDDDDIRNIFNGRSVTMYLIENSLFQTFYHFIFNIHSLYMFYNYDNSREIYKLKVNCLYLSKWLSKPKYSNNDNIAIPPKTIAISPKTTLLIIMLLLMCGDTGVSINPGPINVPVIEEPSTDDRYLYDVDPDIN